MIFLFNLTWQTRKHRLGILSNTSNIPESVSGRNEFECQNLLTIFRPQWGEWCREGENFVSPFSSVKLEWKDLFFLALLADRTSDEKLYRKNTLLEYFVALNLSLVNHKLSKSYLLMHKECTGDVRQCSQTAGDLERIVWFEDRCERGSQSSGQSQECDFSYQCGTLKEATKYP